MNLQEFLNKNVVEGLTKEIVLSDRFKDENGEPLKFKIQAITKKQHGELIKKSTKTAWRAYKKEYKNRQKRK